MFVETKTEEEFYYVIKTLQSKQYTRVGKNKIGWSILTDCSDPGGIWIYGKVFDYGHIPTDGTGTVDTVDFNLFKEKYG